MTLRFVTAGALMVALLGRSPFVREGILSAYGLGAKVGVLLPYSRKHELEADRIGLILMAKAGYDPRAAVLFWKRMDELFGGKARPELLSTHPNDRRRIKEIEDFLLERSPRFRRMLEGAARRRGGQPLETYRKKRRI